MEVTIGSSAESSKQEFSPDLLRVYYNRIFPYDALFNWLSYGNDPNTEGLLTNRDYFSQREFSFTIEDDIYIRYQSFRDCSEMKAAIQKKQPHKIDIGAVFRFREISIFIARNLYNLLVRPLKTILRLRRVPSKLWSENWCLI